jgi:hypothetical protein
MKMYFDIFVLFLYYSQVWYSFNIRIKIFIINFNIMSDFNIKCKCGLFFSEENFNRHFAGCSDFRKTFKSFDAQFGEFLKQFSEPKENLLIMRVLMKQYIGVLENKIRKK